MEQILSKADAYNWINRLQDTLQKHHEKAFFCFVAQDKDGNNDEYFRSFFTPLLCGTLQEEINKATILNYWIPEKKTWWEVDLRYLRDYIINENNVGMGLLLLDCAHYCRSIVHIMRILIEDETVYEKTYSETLNSIDKMFYELCVTLTLEFPDRKEEINNAYYNTYGEKEEHIPVQLSKQHPPTELTVSSNQSTETNLPFSDELLRIFKGNKEMMDLFLTKIKDGLEGAEIVRRINYLVGQGYISKEDSRKQLWRVLHDEMGLYKKTYQAYNKVTKATPL